MNTIIKTTYVKKDSPPHQIKVGQYYFDKTTKQLYVVADSNNNADGRNYHLICVTDGRVYSWARELENVLGQYKNDFEFIENVSITFG